MASKGKKTNASKKLLALILALIFILSGSLVIFSRILSAAELSTGYPLTIKDDSGYTLVIPKAPERIVSLNPATTEILFAAGLGDKVVGVTTNCDYPSEVSKIAKVGDMNINIEALISLRPDLVVGIWDLQQDILQRIRSLGLRVLVINPVDANGILKAIETVGIVGGDVSVANKTIVNIKTRMNTVAQKIAGKTRPKVFVEIWNDPLMTAGGGTFIDEIITLAGGNNIAKNLNGWPVINNEFIISSNPEVVLLTCYNKTEVMQRNTWQRISALVNNKVFEVDANLASRNGPRFIDAIESFAKIFNPEVFK